MIGVGLSVGLAGAPQSGGAAEPNPNLLLWSEAFDNAVWVATSATVTANATNDPDGFPTADGAVFTAGAGALAQTSQTAATSGSTASLVITLPGAWTRRELTGTFDGLAYTFSAWFLDNGSGADVLLRIQRSGGFLVTRIADVGGGASFFAWGAQLEQAAAATAYVKREGS